MHGYAPLLLCYFLFHSYSIRVIKKYNYNVFRIREFIKEYSFINEIVSCSQLNDRLLSRVTGSLQPTVTIYMLLVK